MYGMYGNPFLMHNPLMLLMMGMNQQSNPYEGNGLLHPVYISPKMMHDLEQSVPPFEDPSYDNAKEGNLLCSEGATASCMQSDDKVKTYTPEGVVKLTELSVPEKVSCFAGCHKYNPCDTNIYSSFIKSEHSCDDDGYYYYTCESFEELGVFGNECAKHGAGAKIDASKVVISGNNRYKIWHGKVMHNRKLGKGRDVFYDDEQVDPGLGWSHGVSVGEGAGLKGMPMTDQELGNQRDNEWFEDRGFKANVMEQYDDIMLMEEEDEDDEDAVYDFDDGYYNDMGMEEEDGMDAIYYDDNRYVDGLEDNGYLFDEGNYDENVVGDVIDGKHHDTLEVMIVSVWGILLSIMFICFCCIMAGFCGYIMRMTRKRWMNEKRRERMRGFVVARNEDDDGISDILNENEEHQLV